MPRENKNRVGWNLYFDRELKKMIQIEALKQGISGSELVNRITWDYFRSKKSSL